MALRGTGSNRHVFVLVDFRSARASTSSQPVSFLSAGAVFDFFPTTFPIATAFLGDTGSHHHRLSVCSAGDRHISKYEAKSATGLSSVLWLIVGRDRLS